MPDTDLSSYNSLFLETALSHLNAIDSEIEKLPTAKNAAITEIYRRIHSLKGSSSVMKHEDISKQCSEMLDFLSEDNLSNVEMLRSKISTFVTEIRSKVELLQL